LTRTVKVWFRDHNDLTIREEENASPPQCVNVALGEVVFEDDNWLRLRHAINDLEGESEDWQIHAVCKKDIIKVEVLSVSIEERAWFGVTKRLLRKILS